MTREDEYPVELDVLTERDDDLATEDELGIEPSRSSWGGDLPRISLGDGGYLTVPAPRDE